MNEHDPYEDGPPPEIEAPPSRHLQAVTPDRPRWRPQLWGADRIMATEFPAPKWAVPGLLCEGVSLLAGPPKVAKSWWLLSVCLAVASGGRALGAIPVRKGPVLYLALEDTPRRLKSRMGQLLGDTPAPPGLELATEWPTMPAGGDVAIADWLDRHPDARMIGIDVFAKVRGPASPSLSAYDADYAAVGRIKKIADQYGIAIVLIHHVRKAGSEDFLQEVSGTNGIAGAADATLILKRARGQADGTLSITGRDVEETEIALTHDQNTGHWLKTDAPADEAKLGDTRAAILKHLRQEGKPLGPTAVAKGTGIDVGNVKKTMQRMSDAGQIWPVTNGRYEAPPAGAQPFPDISGDIGTGGVPTVPPVPETF
ncbi:AAA family ATPase [Kineosporia sp. J2-2]|uniref:AAA family ATPase n=1 Tax=Kineosporia corallincola TaxID=2835133 RepID=A0ABS5TP52_9ACTN|nr:AAA family ATPase [Kineosporia corallincola]MBT0771369.1 AAA family ATPase [Kineosporia corallincola]